MILLKRYVVAHEVGHHVQNLLGISTAVRQEQAWVSKVEANRLSVKMELQADCFAGIWGRSVQEQNLLEVGDDRLQKQANGVVVLDSFTHGTSKERQEWFMRGFNSGDIKACNTFEN